MAFPNPFRRKTENTRTCWGYTFELTPEHLTPEQMHTLKHSYDVLGEEALMRLMEISPPPCIAPPRNNKQYAACMDKTAEAPEKDRNLSDDKMPGKKGNSMLPQRDLYALLRDNADKDEKLGELWREVNTVPGWVDWEQIARGQDVFYRYSGAAITGLAYQSLLGGLGAARIVETLARTGGFSTKVARRRIFETFQHILQCTKSVASMQPGGEGFASSIRVRLLHAAVRQRIMKMTESRPEYYKVAEFGVPVNDLDCIATIGTFSATLIWLSFPRQGIFLRAQEIEDYVALWRYIGYVIGCPTEYFETPARAKSMMEMLLYYEIEPSSTSQILANNLIRSLADQPPTWASADMLIASARWMNGNELCDRLNLPRPGLYYWALMCGQCIFFMATQYAYRTIPALDRRKNAMLRQYFWKAVVESSWGLQGQETRFDFKYVPEYGILTELGKAEEQPRLQGEYVERRNLTWLFIGLVVWTVGWYVSLKIAWRVVGSMLK